MNTRSCFVLEMFLVVGLVGCRGQPSKPGIAPVRGTVTYKGEPVTQGVALALKTLWRC
jgi:hypothetical protein